MDMKPLSVFGLVEFLVPGWFIGVWERVAFRNSGDARRRRGVTQLARLEGLTVLWVFRDGESRPTGSREIIGALGLPMLLVPGKMLDVALRVMYANAADIEVRGWVTSATRVLGLLYVLAALGIIPRDGK
ncbi:MAG: hypothetical protein ACOC2A_03605 [Halanaeroarchaeum sp.]